MKHGVSGKTLLMTAGMVWLIAGGNILQTGITCWADSEQYWLLKLGETSLVFMLFFGIIFQRLFRKHTHRIALKTGNNCPFAFFDARGWVIMAVMISFGIAARKLQLFPVEFIAVFYTGLSLALMGTGMRFIKRWMQYDSAKNKP